MRADNSHHLLAAARRRALEARQRAVATLRRLDRAGAPVSFEVVAREAGVSRSWLYGQQDLRVEIQRLRACQSPGSTAPTIPARQRASDASRQRRLAAVNEQIRRLREENRQLREQLAWTLGERRAAAARGPKGPQGAPKRSIGPCS